MSEPHISCLVDDYLSPDHKLVHAISDMQTRWLQGRVGSEDYKVPKLQETKMHKARNDTRRKDSKFIFAPDHLWIQSMPTMHYHKLTAHHAAILAALTRSNF